MFRSVQDEKAQELVEREIFRSFTTEELRKAITHNESLGCEKTVKLLREELRGRAEEHGI